MDLLYKIYTTKLYFDLWCISWFIIGMVFGAIPTAIIFRHKMKRRWDASVAMIEGTSKLLMKYAISMSINSRLFKMIDDLLERR